jgi:alkylhydroperoxidase family enzyme
MANIEQARKALLRRVLEGDGTASTLERRCAFNNTDLTEPLRQLVNKVAVNSSAVSDEDIDRARQAGLSENQIFEMVVCAAIGQATRQYEGAKAALESAQRS